MKEKIQKEIMNIQRELCDLSHKIHDNPKLVLKNIRPYNGRLKY
jgi:uncharacterized protein YeeX (DUF496 family)